VAASKQTKRADGAEHDWQTASKRCLTTALDRLDDLARESADAKQLESIIKTVGDVVGAAGYLGRKSPGASGGEGSEADE
jgi:hypothetical protein